jgi:hypothetical protein
LARELEEEAEGEAPHRRAFEAGAEEEEDAEGKREER